MGAATAGRDALPLEAQRLGLVAHASDLDPVAVLINKTMIEIPPNFAGKRPVNPKAHRNTDLIAREWTGAQGLADDVRYYAEESPAHALEALARLERRCRTLAAVPQRGRIVPEQRAVDVLTYREPNEGPWRIVHRYDADRVHVIAALDARRELAGLLLERLVR